MRHASLPVAVVVAALCGAAVGAQAGPLDLSWAGAHSAPDGQFSGAAFVRGRRVYSGFETDPITFDIDATIYTATGFPGSIMLDDLGLNTNPSFGVSVAEDGQGEYWAVATESLPFFETNSHIFHSTDLANPVQIIGPGPGFDPNVSLNAINRNGVAVGTVGFNVPLIANSVGGSAAMPYSYDAQLWGVDSSGTLMGGAAAPSSGADLAATIFDFLGTVLYQDSVPGVVADLEGDFAVGQSDGRAAYWEKVGSVWQIGFLEITPGTPLLGELIAIDHEGSGLAGGWVEGDRAVAVDLSDGSWEYVDDLAGLPTGTLSNVVGVASMPQSYAIAAIDDDFTGWDVATLQQPATLPAPGLWFALPLLCVGLAARRRTTAGVVTSPQHFS